MEHIKCHRTLSVGWSCNISRVPRTARNYTLNIFVILSTRQDMSMYTDLHNFTSTPLRSMRFHGFELRVQGKIYFVRVKLGYKIDSYVCYHISAASTFFMHGSLTCWTWSTLPKFLAIIPCKNSWTVSCMFTGSLANRLFSRYEYFQKEIFHNFQGSRFSSCMVTVFCKRTYTAIFCRVIEGLGNGIAVNICPYIYIYEIFEVNMRGLLDVLFYNLCTILQFCVRTYIS